MEQRSDFEAPNVEAFSTSVRFSGARNKLARAGKHIAELSAEILAFRNRARLEFVRVEETGEHEVFMLRFSEPEPDLSMVIGDAFHCLRITLDYLVCQVARERGHSDEYLKFPFAATEENLKKEISKRKEIDQDMAQVILSWNTFGEGGCPWLYGMHLLDIIDKHRQILPSYVAVRARMPLDGRVPREVLAAVRPAWANSPAFQMLDSMVADLALGSAALVLKGRNPWHSFQLTEDSPWEVRFPEGLPFAGESVLAVLEILHKELPRLVDSFEALPVGPPN